MVPPHVPRSHPAHQRRLSQAFLNSKFGEAYHVYNLCSERSYDPSKFGHRVSHFPFPDHQPCPLEMLPRICAHAELLLGTPPAVSQQAAPPDGHAGLTLAVHCKAGKGRTGLVVCALLMHLHARDAEPWTADMALEHYAAMRTLNGEGVTIPSQRRWVRYYERILHEGSALREPREVVLHSLTFFGVPNLAWRGGCRPVCEVYEDDRLVLTVAAPHRWRAEGADDGLVLPLENVAVSGNVRLRVRHKNAVKGKAKMFAFWIHTSYLSRSGPLVLAKSELDGAFKDRKCKKFSEGFSIALQYTRVADDDGAPESDYSTQLADEDNADEAEGDARHATTRQAEPDAAAAAEQGAQASLREAAPQKSQRPLTLRTIRARAKRARAANRALTPAETLAMAQRLAETMRFSSDDGYSDGYSDGYYSDGFSDEYCSNAGATAAHA